VCFSGLLLGVSAAHAQLSIEITGAGAQRIPVAIVRSRRVDPRRRRDAHHPRRLERSGLSRARGAAAQPGAHRGVDDQLRGVARPARRRRAARLGRDASRRRYEARFRLYDTVKQTPLGGIAYTLTKDQLRANAHRIADFVYEKLTGEKGVFSTRIAYVAKRGNRYELNIADADGAGEETALASSSRSSRPPGAERPAPRLRVLREQKPVVYVHSLSDGKRAVVANFKGSNSAPAWSPDGKTLAVTLSRDGGSQLFPSAPTAAACGA